MTALPPSTALRGCARCGLVQSLPAIPARHLARCARCLQPLARPHTPRSARLTAALALAALALYPAAMALPVIRIQRFGHTSSATIWSGASDLIAEGDILIGLLVFACSIVAPLAKIGGTLLLALGALRRHAGARAYRVIEWIGRWGMLDVLLVAVLVAAVKLGNWAEVHPGPGIAAFAGVVVFSLLASASFNPHAIWDES